MEVEKLSDRTVRITETVTKVSETDLESLYEEKERTEERLAKINEKITETEKLGVIRGH